MQDFLFTADGSLPMFGKYGYQLLFVVTLLLIILYLSQRVQYSSNPVTELQDKHHSNETAHQTHQDVDETEFNLSNAEDLSSVEHIPLKWERMTDEDMITRSEAFYKLMQRRRTIRLFSSETIPRQVIDNVLLTAGTSPSGAHMEPWTYVVVSCQSTKEKLRQIVEKEEEINYMRRMGKDWVNALKPFRTNWIKPYITEAPFIILAFRRIYSVKSDGKKQVHYYSELSLAISFGILLTALHNAGLFALTSTPLNCGPAIRELLQRPSHEKLIFLLPVGLPGKDCSVPDLLRKPLEKIAIYV